jgi:putative ABC transport system permease protein
MRTLGIETRYALRGIWKRPGLSALVVLTLALGLGANAAIFGVVDALLLRPFTIPNLDRIAMVAEAAPDDGLGNATATVSPANFLDWRKQATSFARLAAFQWWDVNLAGIDEPERVAGFFVSADLFPALGVEPALGRTFTRDEETRGRHRLVVLSHGLWQRRFGGDPFVVGKPVMLDAQQHEVIGVAPKGFDFPLGAEIWAPLSFDAEAAGRRRPRYLSVVGRLAHGRTIDDAKAEMAVIGARLQQQYPDVNRDRDVRVSTLLQGMRDPGNGPFLGLMQASAAFVLLIACANIANLLLARGAERQRDLAVRLAIGASRARVVRELLIESAALAMAAIPAALALAWVALRLMRVSMPAQVLRFIDGWDSLDVDLRLVAFTVALALATVVLFGILPAVQASRHRLAEALKEGGRSATAGHSKQRLRRALVIGEVALALPLLVASGLGVIGAHRFLNGPQGYDPDGLLTMQAVLPEARYRDAPARRQFAQNVVDRLAALPGVQHVAAVNVRPSSGNNVSRSLEIDGRPHPDPARPPSVDYRAASPSFFEAMRIPIVRGRGFTPGDDERGAPVAIVTESMARKYFSDGDPIGHRLRLGGGEWATIVGIAGDVIHDWFGRRWYPTVYQPFAQAPAGSVAFIVRAGKAGDASALTRPAIQAARAVDPLQPVFDVATMRESLRVRTIGLQYVAVIMAVFGGLALVLAMVGVYSLMVVLMVQRTHEIGVRIALGATRTDVLRLAVGQTARLTAAGTLLGLVLAIALGRLMEAGMLGIVSSDIRLSGAIAIVLVGAALAAGYVPARRATSIDPIIALRSE